MDILLCICYYNYWTDHIFNVQSFVYSFFNYLLYNHGFSKSNNQYVFAFLLILSGRRKMRRNKKMSRESCWTGRMVKHFESVGNLYQQLATVKRIKGFIWFSFNCKKYKIRLWEKHWNCYSCYFKRINLYFYYTYYVEEAVSPHCLSTVTCKLIVCMYKNVWASNSYKHQKDPVAKMYVWWQKCGLKKLELDWLMNQDRKIVVNQDRKKISCSYSYSIGKNKYIYRNIRLRFKTL